MKLDPWQKEFLDTKGDKILCCGRQIGKSVICGIDAGKYALNNKKKVILMIAPTERQSYALFGKTLNYIYETDKSMIMKGKNRPTKSKISLKNGTIIWCLPVGLNGLGVRFLTVDRLYADEAARIDLMVWDAVTPMLLTTGGDTILLGTPFGCDGYFYDVLINKENAFNSFKRFRKDSLTVVTEREICATWLQFQQDKAIERIAQEKARKTTLVFAQEYMGQPLNDLLQVFPDKLLKEVMILDRRDHIRPGRDYFLGQDIADMGKDTSAWEILDGTNKDFIEQVENITRRRVRTPERVKLTLDLERSYGFRQIGVDDGGIGSGDFGYLLSHSSTRRKTVGLNNASRALDRDGEKKKRLLKEDMFNNLLAMMEHKEIKLLKDDSIYESLRSIQFETSGGKTKYYGSDSHIAEAIVRSAWLVKTKRLNVYISY